MRQTFAVSRELARRARELAQRRGVPLSEIYRQGLEQILRTSAEPDPAMQSLGFESEPLKPGEDFDDVIYADEEA